MKDSVHRGIVKIVEATAPAFSFCDNVVDCWCDWHLLIDMPAKTIP